MAEIPSKYVQQVFVNEEVKWAKHYSSNHQILLVGEGDFSFSLSLAKSFGSASNIVASSLDSYDDVIEKYKRAEKNLNFLRESGAKLLHGVDATKMHLQTDLQMRKFDQIIYNFPHAGFHGKEDDNQVIMMHQHLVYDFFKSASHMLRPYDEVHVTHKTESPYDRWNIRELAARNHLALVECVEFKPEDYPRYNNKRGEGSRCDNSFRLGKCSTFIFELSLNAVNACVVMSHAPVGNYGYLDYARLTDGQVDENLAYVVHNELRSEFQRYKAENCGEPLNGYINFLEELQNLCKHRLAHLQRRQQRELVRQYGFYVEDEPKKGSSSIILSK